MGVLHHRSAHQETVAMVRQLHARISSHIDNSSNNYNLTADYLLQRALARFLVSSTSNNNNGRGNSGNFSCGNRRKRNRRYTMLTEESDSDSNSDSSDSCSQAETVNNNNSRNNNQLEHNDSSSSLESPSPFLQSPFPAVFITGIPEQSPQTNNSLGVNSSNNNNINGRFNGMWRARLESALSLSPRYTPTTATYRASSPSQHMQHTTQYANIEYLNSRSSGFLSALFGGMNDDDDDAAESTDPVFAGEWIPPPPGPSAS